MSARGVIDEDFIRAQVKAELRKRMKGLRAMLPAEVRAAHSKRIGESLCALDAWNEARTVALFMPSSKEVDVEPYIASAVERGKRVVLPRVDRETEQLVMHPYMPGDALVESRFGIREPHEDACVVSPSELDFIVVPALAIDASGHRIGYGRGYYDRLLASAKSAFSAGVAFDFQFVVELPFLSHDVALRVVVTEARTHWPSDDA